MKHKFTSEQCKRGGWTRAKQKAQERVSNPTQAEKATRLAVEKLQWKYIPEYEIWNEIAGYPQFFDVYLFDYNIAIEVDGSHSWHSAKTATKMAEYDYNKSMWCKKHSVLLVNVNWNHFCFTGEPDTAIALYLQDQLKTLIPYSCSLNLDVLY